MMPLHVLPLVLEQASLVSELTHVLVSPPAAIQKERGD